MSSLPVWAYIAWAASLLAGFVAGRYYERHMSNEESAMRNAVTAYNTWYYRRAPMLVTGVAVIALVGIWLAAAATITNGQQDRRADLESRVRDAAFSKVQRCFDQYAQDQSASSTAVREASVVKDDAAAKFNVALNAEGRAFKAVVRNINEGVRDPVAFERLLVTLRARDRAARVVEQAQAALDRARAENPVPDAPSVFCSVKP